jgi:hypothetical protein
MYNTGAWINEHILCMLQSFIIMQGLMVVKHFSLRLDQKIDKHIEHGALN